MTKWILYALFLVGTALTAVSLADERAGVGLGTSVQDMEATLKELNLEIELEPTAPVEGKARWLGQADTVIVELHGTRENLDEIAVTAGFSNDDIVANAKSLAGLMSVVVVALPQENRSPVARWLMEQVKETANAKQGEEPKATYATNERQFQWLFWKSLGFGQLSVRAMEHN